MNDAIKQVLGFVFLVGGAVVAALLPEITGGEVSSWMRVAAVAAGILLSILVTRGVTGLVDIGKFFGSHVLEVLAVVLVCASIYVYYNLGAWVEGASTLMKVGALLGGIFLALVVAAISPTGQSIIEFSKGSRTELRKMVWPTRAETVQTTMIVLVLVVLVSLFLWGVDTVVFKSIYDLLLGVDT